MFSFQMFGNLTVAPSQMTMTILTECHNVDPLLPIRDKSEDSVCCFGSNNLVRRQFTDALFVFYCRHVLFYCFYETAISDHSCNRVGEREYRKCLVER